jgi:SAM-dependent methyltransferase
MKKSSNIYSINFNFQENAPWNIGKPQPILIKLFEKYSLTGPVLDIGCGAGDLSISIANLGFQVLGIDISENAIEICKNKITSLKPEVKSLLDFRICDAFKLTQLNKKFGSIVDSGFYHLFDQNIRDELADELFNSLILGGRYYLIGFAINSPIPGAPKQVTQDEIRKRFRPEKDWKILNLEMTEFITVFAPPRDRIPAVCACIEKAAR